LSTREQGLRYVVVGAWNTLFGYGLFALLQLTLGHHVSYLILLTFSTAVAILNAYVMYRWLVFKVEGHWWRDLGRFSLVYLVAYGVNLIVLPFLVEVFGLPVLLAQALVVGGTVLASFLAHRHFSFRRPHASRAAR
jgi:putative flippase GtrA